MLQRLFSRSHSSYFWLFLFILLVSCDLASKKYVTDHLNFRLGPDEVAQVQGGNLSEFKALYDGKEAIPLLGKGRPVAWMELYFNNRFVFSLGPNLRYVSILFTAVAILGLLVFRLRNPSMGPWLPWVLVFAGATGNLIDKLFLKSLVTREWVFSLTPLPGHISGVVDFFAVIWFGLDKFDFFPLTFLSWHVWPIFNIADVMIDVGVVLLFLTQMEIRKTSQPVVD